MPHLLVIGGSGMLGGVAFEFSRRGWTVSVVGRRTGTLDAMVRDADAGSGHLFPLAADYTSDSFVGRLREQCERLGPPAVVVAWIHMTAPDVPLLAASELAAASAGEPIDFIHVLSRLRTADPRDRTVPIPFRDEAALRALPGLTYRQAVLGWIVEPSGSRWLTDDEIAAGVIGAVDSGAAVTAIGRTDPVESNPTHRAPT